MFEALIVLAVMVLLTLVVLVLMSVVILLRSPREAEYRRQDKLAKQRLKQSKRSRSTFI